MSIIRCLAIKNSKKLFEGAVPPAKKSHLEVLYLQQKVIWRYFQIRIFGVPIENERAKGGGLLGQWLGH